MLPDVEYEASIPVLFPSVPLPPPPPPAAIRGVFELEGVPIFEFHTKLPPPPELG
jgi:hypothetical protein